LVLVTTAAGFGARVNPGAVVRVVVQGVWGCGGQWGRNGGWVLGVGIVGRELRGWFGGFGAVVVGRWGRGRGWVGVGVEVFRAWGGEVSMKFSLAVGGTAVCRPASTA